MTPRDKGSHASCTSIPPSVLIASILLNGLPLHSGEQRLSTLSRTNVSVELSAISWYA